MLIPKTKRYLYNHILEWYNESLREKLFRPDFCFTFYGVRHIGKTILLKQLNETIPNSKYYDCTNYDCKDDEHDLVEKIMDDYEDGVRVFLIDEICKYIELTELIGTIKCSGNDMTFIITGSTCEFVKNIGYRIGRGPVEYLTPIMYCEQLSWKFNIGLKETINHSNLSEYMDYVKNGPAVINLNNNSYIASVVEDIMTSYKIRLNNKDIPSDFNYDENLLNNMVKYMTLVGVSGVGDSGNYTLISRFHVEDMDKRMIIRDSIKFYNNIIKCTKTSTLTKYLKLLMNSGLLNTFKALSGDDLFNYNYNNFYAFRYPQYVCSVLDYNGFEDLYYTNVIEMLLLNACSSYYVYTGKYRSIEQKEIDVCYGVAPYFYGLEIKCRPLDKIDIAHYENIAQELELHELVFTAIDLESTHCIKNNHYVVRPDILNLLLELGVIYDFNRKLTISELIVKYLTRPTTSFEDKLQNEFGSLDNPI